MRLAEANRFQPHLVTQAEARGTIVGRFILSHDNPHVRMLRGYLAGGKSRPERVSRGGKVGCVMDAPKGLPFNTSTKSLRGVYVPDYPIPGFAQKK
jgi:hypothetical protein